MTLPLGKIICGDAVEEMRRLPDSSIDLVITSPPYNLGNSEHVAGRGRFSVRDGYTTHADNLPHADYVAWQRRVLTECMRVIKPTGAIFYNHKERMQGGVWQHRHDILDGFPVRQRIIWKNGAGMNLNPHQFNPSHEDIYLVAKPAYRLRAQENQHGSVWDIPRVKKKNKAHPAPFPVALVERVLGASECNEVVLDPFMGSGTTAIAAIKCGVSFVGIDNSPQYCKIARRRVEDARRQKRMEL